MQDEKIIQSVNIPPIPPVKRVRLSWYQTILHTISIYWRLRMQRLKLAILEWLGVDQLIRNEVNARQSNDATAIGLLQRQSTQINRIAAALPALVEARKRLEFYEGDEILRHALKRFNKANPTLTLEKNDGQKTHGQAHDHGSRAGAGGQVPESPRSDAQVQDGKAGILRAQDDGPVEGRGEVQGVAAAEGLAGAPLIGDPNDRD